MRTVWQDPKRILRPPAPGHRLGTRKLSFLLLPQLGEHAPRVGRDYLFALLAGHGLLIRRRERRVVTTHTCLPLFRWPNLIEHLLVSRAEPVWISDITYVRLLSGWSYLSLITDLYTPLKSWASACTRTCRCSAPSPPCTRPWPRATSPSGR
ncbi:hypothetical protein [Hymenobacter arizonensis]|uniref:hypothetical protein n=1 Tax=Hymenobacter arizonensis TaxID=1227077 RepID=UPI0015A5C1BF|nr:hypothetical protein [Hymenobacter arizonensis]